MRLLQWSLIVLNRASPDRLGISNLALILALLIAYYEYRNAKSATKAERKEASQNHQTEVYHTLDEKYVDYLRLCFDNPDLDIWDLDEDKPRNMSPDQRKQELIAFEMLICIFERAFITYYDQPIEFKQRQWAGWDAYIKSFAKRENFSNAWANLGFSFDDKFQKYMNDTINNP